MVELRNSNLEINALNSKNALWKIKIMELGQFLMDSKSQENCILKDVKANKACIDKEKSVIVDATQIHNIL